MAPNKNLNFLVSAIFALSLLLSVGWATGQGETDRELDFSYEPGAENGPERWGEIREEWATCGKGKMQSPIDISSERVEVDPHLGDLHDSYRPANAVLHNRGHDVMIKWEGDAGALWINGTAYNLLQLHWHAPSEHAINGRRYAMEMHVVHQSADKKIAVVGILYRIGRPDPFLEMLEPQMKKIAKDNQTEEKVGMVDPREVRGTSSYYRYMGSLTTPPCAEGVVWTVVKKVRMVSEEQLKLLREAVHDGAKMNARPLQEVNNRTVSIFRCQRRHYQDVFVTSA